MIFVEHSKETVCGCLNDYTKETFFESFGKDDSEMRKCNNCPNMVYDNGILTCTKFCL